MAVDQNSIIIPFFSLGANILPGEPLPLHIFEPRYQRMVKYCLGENHLKRPVPFGISLTRAKMIEPVGVSVNISSVLRTFKDGRSVVLGWGESRYRLLEVIQGEDFPKARVRFVEDLEEDIDLTLQAEVVRLFEQALKLELVSRDNPASSEVLSSWSLGVRILSTSLSISSSDRFALTVYPSIPNSRKSFGASTSLRFEII